MAELKEGRHVAAKLLGPAPAVGPDGAPLTAADGRLDFDYRGSLPVLLDWLAKLPLEELHLGPLGLTPIYRKYHGGD
jgi:ABC-2 type transport system ATP-binding protein